MHCLHQQQVPPLCFPEEGIVLPTPFHSWDKQLKYLKLILYHYTPTPNVQFMYSQVVHNTQLHAVIINKVYVIYIIPRQCQAQQRQYWYM